MKEETIEFDEEPLEGNHVDSVERRAIEAMRGHYIADNNALM